MCLNDMLPLIPHPEGVVQIGIFCPFAENTAVAGEDV